MSRRFTFGIPAGLFMTAGIYCIRNVLTGRGYIGSAINIGNRWRDHRTALRAGRHHSIRLQRAWTKYGENSFTLDVLEVVPEKASLIAREQAWLDKMRPMPCTAYNMSRQATSNLGMKHTTATRKKLREAAKRRWAGQPLSHRKLRRGKGRPAHSAETRAKLSVKAKARGIPHETQEQAWAANRGGTHPPEWRAHMSTVMTARGNEPAVREANRRAANIRWARQRGEIQ